jgi:hypothetical protein
MDRKYGGFTMNATNEVLEGSGAMPYEDLDEIAYCHHCGSCHPAEDHCKCFRAKMERDQKAIDRRLRFEMLAFVLFYVAPMICGIALGMFAIFAGFCIQGTFILLTCLLLSLFVLFFTEPKK